MTGNIAQFEQLVKLCIEAAEEKFGKLPPIRIRFDLRGRAAGQAYWRSTLADDVEYGVRFNREAMSVDWEHTVKETIPHEVAHIVAYAKPQLGAKGHNAQWRWIAQQLGCKGNRCHAMKLTPAKRRNVTRYAYRTDRGTELLVGPKHHKLIQQYGIAAGVFVRSSREKLDRHHWLQHPMHKKAA